MPNKNKAMVRCLAIRLLSIKEVSSIPSKVDVTFCN